ncbi:MAG TPA: hypothetical protein VFZ95_07645, partial [Steroidobacteraceae bacterium]
MTIEVQSPALMFPTGFCCNCGDTNCMNELQDTRVTRNFGFGGTQTTFQLSVPVCAACRKTTRRRPVRFFGRLLVLAGLIGAWFLALVLLGSYITWPLWIADHRVVISAVLGLVVTLVFYRMRRAKPPKTSFYQPVRIKEANVHFAGIMSGPGQVVFMKLAFTNPDYLNVFSNANREAIQAGLLS